MMMKSVFWWRKPEYPEETNILAAFIIYVCSAYMENKNAKHGKFLNEVPVITTSFIFSGFIMHLLQETLCALFIFLYKRS